MDPLMVFKICKPWFLFIVEIDGQDIICEKEEV